MEHHETNATLYIPIPDDWQWSVTRYARDVIIPMETQLRGLYPPGQCNITVDWDNDCKVFIMQIEASHVQSHS